MLQAYKNQNKTEIGFRFIKGNAFKVSSVFLKKERRMQALMMVMPLCLMVYSLTAFILRKGLDQYQETIQNQLKKSIKKPTMAYLYRLFHDIQIGRIDWKGYVQESVVNLKPITKEIVKYFGNRDIDRYGLKTC